MSTRGSTVWDQGQCEIFGVDPSTFVPTLDRVRPLISPGRFRAVGARIPQGHEGCQYLPDRISRPAAERRSTLVHRNGSGKLRRTKAASSGSAASPPISLSENGPKNAKSCWPRRSIIARAMWLPSCNRSCVSRAPIASTSISARSTAALVPSPTAHRLLARSRWEGADLNRLVEEEFAPYRAGGSERISAQGPIVLLPPAIAQTIALALHELVTNAAKYGALSNEPGRVDLSWRTEPGKLELTWTESGGPEITPPKPPRLRQSGYHRRYRTPARWCREFRLASQSVCAAL